jgi:hypothetical protein
MTPVESFLFGTEVVVAGPRRLSVDNVDDRVEPAVDVLVSSDEGRLVSTGVRELDALGSSVVWIRVIPWPADVTVLVGREFMGEEGGEVLR